MQFDLNIPYYVYCESAPFLFLQQPLNALSNAAFFFFAFIVWTQDRGRGTSLSLLALLMAIVGFCHMTWHATGQQTALAFALGSDLVLATVLTTILTHQILHWPPVNAVMVAVILLLSSLLGRDIGLPFMLQNGGSYLPFMLFAVVLAFSEIQRGRVREAKFLIFAAYILFVGLIFRSLDWAMCFKFPYGLHFAWQICRAAAIWLAVEAIWKDRQDDEREASA